MGDAMSAQSFRKKPVVIQAAQWFCPGHCPIWAQDRVRELSDRFEVATLEGCMEGIPGDWIIRGVKGEIYPCKPDIFEMTYEPAEANAPDVTVTEGWQTMNSAPYDKTNVALIALRSDGSWKTGVGWYMPLTGWQCFDERPTHWAPLPKFDPAALKSTTPQTGSQE